MAYFFVDENYDAPHIRALSKWMAKLWEAIQHWHGRWNGDDGGAAPMLHWKGDGASKVVDTRRGHRLERDVSGTKAAILEVLGSPRPVSDLEAVAGPDWEREFAELDRWELIWREGDRAMSLVLPDEVSANGAAPGDR